MWGHAWGVNRRVVWRYRWGLGGRDDWNESVGRAAHHGGVVGIGGGYKIGA
jgi:hypothetical protein